jgi:hypothetical protein
MRATLARIQRATPAELRLLTEAVLALGAAAFVVALLPFRRVTALARPPKGSPPAPAAREQAIRAVAWAVAASARRVPWRAKCIEQGFAAQWMLRRRRVPAVLHYGIARRDGDLTAHVWVRSAETDVIGCENLADFAEVAQFPSTATR